MDHENQESELRRSGSSGRLSCARRRSLSSQVDDALDKIVAEAGDIGDRALKSYRWSSSGRSHNDTESGRIVVPVEGESVFVEFGDKKNEYEKQVSSVLDYITHLLSLAVFGILGVGSFLMGWVVVFRGDIMEVSDHLAIGLSTGFLGSLTTFSGWNQKMLELSVNGQWAFTVLGIIIGLLWGLFGSLERKEFKTGSREAQLFLACIVGPFVVWIRWFLARFNGHGLGKNGKLKWVPFGTLAANVLAACLMAALATLKKEFGLLGCLSTVSTFIAEVHAMRENMHPGRAYAYATLNFTISFVLGTLIYSVLVWARGY
ncbi:hypothetical protein BUALT_Bualt07G0138800 [Buddleja alternifolia]|uniref:Fluoride ion transporter CrcB n=1 Tax=Buddleja alternifolia TaxID=168488 RepID=A0AAV6XLA6_9LAMI|nr:hypothetical protein BUALT_Bualt07G0138800 [Buddleja alternifolia]